MVSAACHDIYRSAGSKSIPGFASSASAEEDLVSKDPRESGVVGPATLRLHLTGRRSRVDSARSGSGGEDHPLKRQNSMGLGKLPVGGAGGRVRGPRVAGCTVFGFGVVLVCGIAGGGGCGRGHWARGALRRASRGSLRTRSLTTTPAPHVWRR